MFETEWTVFLGGSWDPGLACRLREIWVIRSLAAARPQNPGCNWCCLKRSLLLKTASRPLSGCAVELMILLVDDEPQLRKIFARRLRQEGFQVTEAADGAEAVKLLNTTAFNLIITDLRMPKVDGVKLARWVRAKWPTLPIILLSGGHVLEEASDMVRENTHFIQKPFEPDTLIETVQRLI